MPPRSKSLQESVGQCEVIRWSATTVTIKYARIEYILTINRCTNAPPVLEVPHHPDPPQRKQTDLNDITTTSVTPLIEYMQPVRHDSPDDNISQVLYHTDTEEVIQYYVRYDDDFKKDVPAYHFYASVHTIHNRGIQTARSRGRGQRGR